MKTLVEIYAGVPDEQVERLLEFRRAHPFQRLRLEDVEWGYISCGSGAEALLILGGGGSRGDSPLEMITRLEDRCRVLSPSYPPVERVETVVDGLVELLQAEGITRTHVYGHSLGCAIAHVLVRRYPEQVDRLVLGSFGLYTSNNGRRAIRALRWLARLPYGVTRAIYQSRMARSVQGLNPADEAYLRASFEELFTLQHNKETFIGQMSLLIDLLEHPAEYGLHTPVERPGQTLILLADDDRGFTRAEQQALIDTYPGAQVKRFPSGGHLIPFTRRDEYARVMDEFLWMSG